jgi:hypothetical protein
VVVILPNAPSALRLIRAVREAPLLAFDVETRSINCAGAARRVDEDEDSAALPELDTRIAVTRDVRHVRSILG